jgi:intermembrane space import and assembly protein 40
MAFCTSYGKDKVMFVTKEDHAEKSTIELPPSEPQAGLLLPSGEINWNCPCLGGMATGPCGVEFRDAFSCFHYSEADPKGSDCYEAFKTMQDCMQQFPKVYNQVGDDKEGGVGSMGLDLGLDDGEIDEDEHAEYADGDEEEKQSSEVVKK